MATKDYKTFTLAEYDTFTLDQYATFLLDPMDGGLVLTVAASACYSLLRDAACFTLTQGQDIHRPGHDKADSFGLVGGADAYRAGSKKSAVNG